MPPEPTATRDEVRAFDTHCIEDLGVPGIVLMENAGRQIADAAVEMAKALGDAPRILVLAGKGNNGGDGFVVARHLAVRGREAEVVLPAAKDDVSGDARANLDILERMGIEVREMPGDEPAEALRPILAEADLVVDALLGTGVRGEIREPFASVITALNDAAPRAVLAVDIPSGMDCETGEPLGPTVRAHRTVTLAAVKAGFAKSRARDFTGRVTLADIGVPWTAPAEGEA